jgi:hypothetical protein
MKDYVELLHDKETNEFYSPYATYYCKTEEEFKSLQEAIEKQIPKKVNVRVNAVYDTKNYHCPNCESNLTGMGFDYCVECGQKIDWGD